MEIILICGQRGSGKDFFVESAKQDELFSTKYPYLPALPYHVEKFATPLHNTVSSLLNISLVNYEQEKDNPLPDPYIGTIRDYFIKVATSVREFDSDFFVKALYERVKNRKGVVVVTDWRFPNEYLYLKKMGVKITTLRIVNPESTIIYTDPSETSLLNYPVDYSLFISHSDN